MINAVLFLLLKCVLYLKGIKFLARFLLSLIESYEKDKSTPLALLVILIFLVMLITFGFTIFDVVSDVIRMEDLILPITYLKISTLTSGRLLLW